MRKYIVLFALACVVALACLASALATPSAKTSRGLIVGIYDEQSSLGNPNWAFPQYTRLGVEALRANLYWNSVAKRRPENARNPADPAYDWAGYDAFVKRAAENRIKVVFSIVRTPNWAIAAREKKKPNRAPARMKDLQDFAFAAAKRYSGSFRPSEDGEALPAVRFWLAWNEPNNPIFLFPQFRYIGGRYRPVSPAVYAKMCNAIWSGVHLTGLSGEKVACGVTAPRGNNSGAQPRSSLSPIPFLRGMKKAGARFDAYAHHPYYGHRTETPSSRPPLRGTAITLGNLDVLIRELTRLYGPKRVWLTEYGYQTNPPDRAFGVSFVNQARYLSQAFAIARSNPRVDMMIWFLVKDEARIGNGWQSGLYTTSGRRKPSWQAFRRMRK
jgi:hypothetical protein